MTCFAINGRDDTHCVAVLDLVERNQDGASRAKGVERLTQVEVWGLGRELGRTIRNILADHHSEDVVPCVSFGDVLAAGADNDDEFTLVITRIAS